MPGKELHEGLKCGSTLMMQLQNAFLWRTMLNKMHWMGNSVKILDSNVLYSRIALHSKMVVLYRGTWRSLDYIIWSSYHPHKQCCNNGNAEQELLRMYVCIDRKEAAGSTSSTSSGNGSEEDDEWTQMFGRCLIWGFVSCAMLLLENQIPFFVLDKLFMQLRTDPGKSIDVLMASALPLPVPLSAEAVLLPHCLP